MGGEDGIIRCVGYVKVPLNIMQAKYNKVCTQLLLGRFLFPIKVTLYLFKAIQCGLLTSSVRKSNASLLK